MPVRSQELRGGERWQIRWDASNLERKLNAFVENMTGMIRSNMEPVAEAIADQSKEECPYDTGHLLSTFEQVWIQTETSVRIQFSYNTPYAHRLHEHPEYHFQNGKKGKYLSDPINQYQAEMEEATQQGVHDARVEAGLT